MKLSTFKNRTSLVIKSSMGYILALRILSGEKSVRTCWTSGSGRFCKNLDYTDDVIAVLQKAGLKENIDFVLENDAPRKGKPGNFILLTAKGKKKIII